MRATARQRRRRRRRGVRVRLVGGTSEPGKRPGSSRPANLSVDALRWEGGLLYTGTGVVISTVGVLYHVPAFTPEVCLGHWCPLARRTLGA